MLCPLELLVELSFAVLLLPLVAAGRALAVSLVLQVHKCLSLFFLREFLVSLNYR